MSALMVVTPAPVSSMALALDRGEPGQREGHGVGAGLQIDDPVWPVPSVTTLRDFSMSTGLDASTFTPGRMAPDESLTMPATAGWEKAGVDRRTAP